MYIQTETKCPLFRQITNLVPNFFTLRSSIAKRENIWFNNPGIKAAKFHFRNHTNDNESHTL